MQCNNKGESKMKKIKNETGRSMVEMLGVLAVIGVLSIGGIYGYRMAMTKIEVNNFINDIKLSLWQFKGMDTTFTNEYSQSSGSKKLKNQMEFRSDLLKRLDEKYQISDKRFFVYTDSFDDLHCPGCICFRYSFDLNDIGNPSYFNQLREEVNSSLKFGSDPAIWVGYGHYSSYSYIIACTPSQEGYLVRAFDSYYGDGKPSL